LIIHSVILLILNSHKYSKNYTIERSLVEISNRGSNPNFVCLSCICLPSKLLSSYIIEIKK
jgi:hypothetical protein